MSTLEDPEASIAASFLGAVKTHRKHSVQKEAGIFLWLQGTQTRVYVRSVIKACHCIFHTLLKSVSIIAVRAPP